MNPLRLLAGKPREETRGNARETLTFTLDNGTTVEVLRVRDPRARRIKLSVSERGARLTLPPRASEVTGERFVREHGDWLMAQLVRNGSDTPLLQPHGTGSIPLRGGDLPVVWNEGRALRLTMCDEALHIAVPAGVRAASLRPPSRVTFKVMSSQWGSLAPNGSVALDLALVLARPSAFEYVLVHELCHLIRPDHSRAFWREVEARFPHWREERDYFHGEGRQLKASLRALLG